MYGVGILKGLGVTIRHFFNTYVEDLRYVGKKLNNTQEFERRQGVDSTGLYTVQYPEEKIAVPERFRFVPFLVVEDDDHPERPGHDWCTSCGICPKVCPPQCIWIVRSEDPVTKRPIPEPEAFFIDIDICMNCGLCAEYCPFDAIKMDHDYELADYDRTGIGVHIHDKEKLSKPFSYWRKIAPTTAWEEAVDRGGWEHIDVIKQKQKSGAPIAKPGPTWDSPYVPPIVPVKEEAPAAETAQAGGEAVGTAAEAAPVEMSAEDAAKEERRKKREAALARKHAKEQGGEG
ncbi:MAG: iron-sulfur binding protein [Chloroflexi bacterium OLB15]|nr:MAG: iron-sulfur binding protein [Chloroflexi bacterium OLB15]